MKADCIVRFAGVLACAGVLHVSEANAATEKVVYAFKGGTDGGNPRAALLDVNGVLYGTTAAGGMELNCTGGCGTVFKVTERGREKVIYSFRGGSDGYDPLASLIEVEHILYGTTSSGVTNGENFDCSNDCGTVFSLTPSGIEKVLHVFDGGSAGTGPNAGLIALRGKFYGTTLYGGSCSLCGTVFSVSKTLSQEVFSFNGTNGEFAEAGLVGFGGKLAGTTFAGGSGKNCFLGGDFGCGTVFSITPSGSQMVDYSFQGGSDGADPAAALVNVNGTLYGTTEWGGAGTCSGSEGATGCGTVFSVSAGGTEAVLHAFKIGSDGANPTSGLIQIGNVLYGTTPAGGASGYGTVYSITLSGKERVLYSFAGGSDGADPEAGLIDVNGTLYGTTSAGGNGYGTVFSIKL